MTAKRGTPEESLRLSVDALGGLQEVGHMFKREDDPAIAGQWLAHCLTATKRDKLSLSQVAKIFRDAHAVGGHEGFNSLAHLCGYNADPIAQHVVVAELQQRAIDLMREAECVKRDMQAITELSPATLALMQHAHLKVSA